MKNPTDNTSLVEEIKKRAAADRLIPGVHVELENIASSTVNDTPTVEVTFRVPQPVSIDVDDKSGKSSVNSSGPHFTYTFIDQGPRDPGFDELNEFYRSRSEVAFKFPIVRRNAKKKIIDFVPRPRAAAQVT